MQPFTFRVQLAKDGTWSWGAFLGTAVKGFGAGAATKFEAVEAIRQWLTELLGHSIEQECICGSKGIYRSFTPGHGHWCPLSEYAVVEMKHS